MCVLWFVCLRAGGDVLGLKRTSVDSLVCPERLRLKAGLFCVFIYLDTQSLLDAAEVCFICVCVIL